MDRERIHAWLRETDPDRLEALWRLADETRRIHVGDMVHLRGLVEMSNHCVRLCHYCGLRAANEGVRRYRMSADEVMECAREAVRQNYGTLVIQAGEDEGIRCEDILGLLRRIKRETPLAVTLSLGERPDDELEAWREAGADRYLLRFETSNRGLLRRIHPPSPGGRDRFEMLAALRRLGYEVGSGVMVGIPGQSYDDLAADIELFGVLELDMVGVGPCLPHPRTPLGRQGITRALSADRQAPNDELTTCKVLALTRLVRPDANIPATTALATLNPDRGRELGLARGANVVMPNLTPARYRADYAIYPAKACIAETAETRHGGIEQRIVGMGRTPGRGRGDAPCRLRRESSASHADGPERNVPCK